MQQQKIERTARELQEQDDDDETGGKQAIALDGAFDNRGGVATVKVKGKIQMPPS